MSNSEDGKLLDWSDVFTGELAALKKSNDEDASILRLSGICLSGGGVRSAIFCGGVIGYFAKKGILSKFDYISMVSGGGYTGAALMNWRESGDIDLNCPFHIDSTVSTAEPDRSDKVDETEMFRRRDMRANAAFVRHLRANVSYLMPTGFKGALVGSYVVLRAILLNLIIWIGIIAGLFRLLVEGSRLWLCGAPDPEAEVSVRDVCDAPGDVGLGAAIPNLVDFVVRVTNLEDVGWLFAGLSLLGLCCIALVLLLMPIFSLVTYYKPKSPGATGSGYRWRRNNERWSGNLIKAAVVLLPLGFLPMIAANIGGIAGWLKDFDLDDRGAAISFGALGAVIASATSIFGLFRARLGGVFGRFSSVTIIFGACLLIYSTALIAMILALELHWMSIAIFATFSVVLAYFCSINDASLGRFYRDRLMEAFLPERDKIVLKDRKKHQPLSKLALPAEESDGKLLTKLQKPKKPIYLINTNLICWWSQDTRARLRKGDNFVLSPLYCGSDSTKWKKTEGVADDRLTLATAMATSGAAANPQGGFAGQGPTTSPAVAVAMALLSLRLGYWLRWKRTRLSSFGNHLHPGFCTFVRQLWPFGRSNLDNRRPNPEKDAPSFLELSDGGHFDNLGLYELLRRECRLIVVCDGGQDPESSYDAFAMLIRRARVDFGANVQFDIRFNEAWSRRSVGDPNLDAKTSGPQDLVARQVANEYPQGAEYADKGYFLASVTYNGNPSQEGEDGYRANRDSRGKEDDGTPKRSPRGLIVYLKSSMIRDVDLTTKGYRGANPLFPFDPTSNQFFSPEQFEAYRDLGEKIAAQMDADLAFKSLFDELIPDDSKERDPTSLSAKLEELDRFVELKR